MTTRGLGEEDFKKIVSYIDFAVNYAKEVQSQLPKDANKLKDFKMLFLVIWKNLKLLEMKFINGLVLSH